MLFALKGIVERSLGDAGPLGYFVHADAGNTLLADHLACYVEDAVSTRNDRWAGIHSRTGRPLSGPCFFSKTLTDALQRGFRCTSGVAHTSQLACQRPGANSKVYCRARRVQCYARADRL